MAKELELLEARCCAPGLLGISSRSKLEGEPASDGVRTPSYVGVSRFEEADALILPSGYGNCNH
jgi:hypothetical protein